MTMTLSRRHSQALEAQSMQDEFEALFQEHWERLCRILYNMLGDWDEAEDLVLEAFVQLYRQPPQQFANPGGWLYRVASNLGLNTLRARKRRQHYETQAGVETLQNEFGSDPASAVEQRLEREQVQAVLSQMKPRSAQILLLRHSGLSYAEIAETLEVAPASVGTLLARAEQEFEKIYTRQTGT